MCRNWKPWAILGVIAVTIAVTAPAARGALPLLLVAACPLSMLLMGVGMARSRRREDRDDTTDRAQAPPVESRQSAVR